VLLVIDQCFRAFDPRTQYDTYALLDAIGVEYVAIEDTGKLWPVAGLKLGFVCTSPRTRLGLVEASADVLLTPSPFVARLVEEFAGDMADGGLEQMHGLVELNRSLIRQALEGSEQAAVADRGSRVSVSRIRLTGRDATLVWGRLLQRGIHTVPCRPFYWARPAEGERYLRIALSRDPEDVERAATAVRDVVDAAVPA
jgi:aspartate/methionine/tyrosine aminotransferase